MWGFANSLVVVLLYPGSLLMPGIYGFIIKLFQTVFGTIVGDYVDTNPRLRGNATFAATLKFSLKIQILYFFSDMGLSYSTEWICSP